MKSLYWSLLLAGSLMLPGAAQTEQKAEKKKEVAAAESPSPAVEKALSGLIDIGYRGMLNIQGDEGTYRSVVNQQKGLRLNTLELNFLPEKSRFLDEARLTANNWGDPYNTARLDAGKRGLWTYSGRYSNLFYYNNLPSFANLSTPGLYAGNQRAYDTSVRNYDHEVRFLPGRIISPYIGFQRNASRGVGVTPLVLDANEYPLRSNIHWTQNTILAGVRVELKRAHATIEQGRTAFNDDQYVYATGVTPGSRPNPTLGQVQVLNTGSESYAVRGRGPYTKVFGSGSITRFLDLTGSYMHSRPEINAGYNMAATGALYVPALVGIYRGQTDQAFGSTAAPQSLAGISAEAHAGIIRARYSFDSDRYESFGSATLTSQFTAAPGGTGPTVTTPTLLNVVKIVNNRQTAEVIADLHRMLTLRGGYRRETGTAHVPGGIVSPDARQFAELERNVVLLGMVLRPLSGLQWSSDYEYGNANKTIYRASLADSQKWRNQVRYQMRTDLSFQGAYSVMVNRNPQNQYHFDARQTSLSAQYFPRGGKNLNFIADYTRSTLASDINYLVPLAMLTADSNYRDNAHTGTLLADIGIPGSWQTPRFTGGGSFVTTSGSRPSRYWQPMGKLSLPVARLAQLYAEWRWYGFRQPYYLIEGFRSHQVTAGIRLTL